MSAGKSRSKTKAWQKTPITNLVRYLPSGFLFARIRINGKLIRRSLETKTLTVAKLRLADLEKNERGNSELNAAYTEGKMTFGEAMAMFAERVEKDPSLKPRTKAHRKERISVIRKTWPAVLQTDIRRITRQDCLNWAHSYKSSAINFNKTAQTIRKIFEIAIESGIRYDNPAQAIKTMKVRVEPLQLPSREQFAEIVKQVRKVNKRYSQDAADLIEFLAYGGFRKSEASQITWNDGNFKTGEILVRGDKETGTKNWSVRTVPMVAEMRKLLERIKDKRQSSNPDERIMLVSTCNGALRSACKTLKIPHITNHDLRHLFATTCIESGVDIPTVARWMGHKDGGALAMKTYGHLRDRHSSNMAQKVRFNPNPPDANDSGPSPAHSNQF
jgi:integrase